MRSSHKPALKKAAPALKTKPVPMPKKAGAGKAGAKARRKG
jgi:hypothetical protein